MAVTDLTTTASVRAVLGVSEKEIRDDVLLAPIYQVRLSEDLRAIDDTLFDEFVTAASAGDARSPLQVRFYDLVQTYAAYKLASYCVAAAPMFAPQTIQDSRTQVSRVADPYKQLKKDIAETLVVLRVKLRTVYAQVNPNYAPPTSIERLFATAAPLGVNPVTG